MSKVTFRYFLIPVSCILHFKFCRVIDLVISTLFCIKKGEISFVAICTLSPAEDLYANYTQVPASRTLYPVSRTQFPIARSLYPVHSILYPVPMSCPLHCTLTLHTVPCLKCSFPCTRVYPTPCTLCLEPCTFNSVPCANYFIPNNLNLLP